MAHPAKGKIGAMVDRKLGLIQRHFAAVMGSKIIRYQTAELLFDGGSWDAWPDLPIRIYTDTGKLISVSWSRFDDLWISSDASLPFSIEGSTIRWVDNSVAKISPVIGGTIRGVMLGQSEMTWGGTNVEIWTRLLIQVDRGWLEVFNALDENGYHFYDQLPEGKFVPCL